APVIAGATGELCRVNRRLAPWLHVAEQPLGKLHNVAEIDLAARRQHQPRRNELIAEPIATVLPGDGANGLLTTQHRSPDRLALERGFEQMVVDKVVGRIDALAELGQ